MVRWVKLAGLTLLLACCAAVAPVLCAEAAAQTSRFRKNFKSRGS